MKKILLMNQHRLRNHLEYIVAGVVKFDRKIHPLIWVESMESMHQILSDENRRLLRWLDCSPPASYADLLETTGLAPDELWRTLQMLINFRLIRIGGENNLLSLIPVSENVEVTIG